MKAGVGIIFTLVTVVLFCLHLPSEAVELEDAVNTETYALTVDRTVTDLCSHLFVCRTQNLQQADLEAVYSSTRGRYGNLNPSAFDGSNLSAWIADTAAEADWASRAGQAVWANTAQDVDGDGAGAFMGANLQSLAFAPRAVKAGSSLVVGYAAGASLAVYVLGADTAEAKYKVVLKSAANDNNISHAFYTKKADRLVNNLSVNWVRGGGRYSFTPHSMEYIDNNTQY